MRRFGEMLRKLHWRTAFSQPLQLGSINNLRQITAVGSYHVRATLHLGLLGKCGHLRPWSKVSRRLRSNMPFANSAVVDPAIVGPFVITLAYNPNLG